MACRVQGAVVGVAILSAAVFCPASTWAHSHSNGGNSSAPGDRVRLAPDLEKIRGYHYSRALPESALRLRFGHNSEIIKKHCPLPITIEAVVKRIEQGRLALVGPRHGLGDKWVNLASALSAISTDGQVRRTGVRKELRGGPECAHEFMVSVRNGDAPHEVVKMTNGGATTPLAADLRYGYVVGFGHDSLIEDNAQKQILKPSYEPNLQVFQPHELERLLQATIAPGQTVTQVDQLIAVAAIARHKLNSIFREVVTTRDNDRKMGVGSGILWLTKPVFDTTNAPVCEDLPAPQKLQDEIRTACLVSRLLKSVGSATLARVKVADATETVDPAHIVQDKELDKQQKVDKLTVAAARRWFVVDQLRRHFGDELPGQATDVFLMMYQDGYHRYVPKIMNEDWREQVQGATEAIIRFDQRHSQWLDATIKGYLTQLHRMDQALAQMPSSNR